MASKKRVRRKKAKARRVSPRLGERVELLARVVQNLADVRTTAAGKDLATAGLILRERQRTEEIQRKYNELSDKLIGLLTPDQVEAARIAGCDPATYAIEWIELQKARIFPSQETVHLAEPLRRFS